jgi:predicted secreted protein
MNGSSIPIATIEQELTIVDRRPQNPESETTEATPQSSPQNVNETVSLDSHSPTEQTIGT